MPSLFRSFPPAPFLNRGCTSTMTDVKATMKVCCAVVIAWVLVCIHACYDVGMIARVRSRFVYRVVHDWWQKYIAPHSFDSLVRLVGTCNAAHRHRIMQSPSNLLTYIIAIASRRTHNTHLFTNTNTHSTHIHIHTLSLPPSLSDLLLLIHH